MEAIVHPFFDELRDPNTRLPNGRPLPPLLNFKPQGLSLPNIYHTLLFVFHFYYIKKTKQLCVLLICRAKRSKLRVVVEAYT